MIDKLISYLKNKKILILGFGREGKSTYKLIRKYLKDQEIYIADGKENFALENEFLKQDEKAICIFGKRYLDNLDKYDIIMKSPGISLKEIDISKYKDKIKSQLELLLEFFNNLTIGVTGTKGKSTTTSLIYTVLKEQNKQVLLLGNIGVPVFDHIDTIDDNTILVLEMSSHQLEYMKVSPKISVILNIYPEHLDHYESYEKYAQAKCNIYLNKSKEDYFLYNTDNETLQKLVNNISTNTYKVSLKGKENSNIYIKNDKVYFDSKPIYNILEPRNLKGEYNLNNIMFVLGISEILSLDIKQTIETIKNFKSLPHRLEYVGKYNDIIYYDNSIGTIPEATIEAIKALKEVDTLIIGGMDRGIDYTEFIQYLNNSKIKNIICMPKTGHEIGKVLKKENVHIVETLEEAVEVAKKVTEKQKICLLSPAAASYGYFKNFEEKGDLYKKLVQQI